MLRVGSLFVGGDSTSFSLYFLMPSVVLDSTIGIYAIPTNIGIVRGTVSVATIVVVSAGVDI